MAWVSGQRYQFRVVDKQTQVEKNETTGTRKVVSLAVVTEGPQAGQRMQWHGYLNSPANVTTTGAELRVMGWRGSRLGDWAGMGSKVFEATAMAETGTNGKTYWRFAWPRPLRVVNVEKAVKADELDALNAELGGLLAKPADLPAAPSAEGDADERDISFP